MICRGLDNAGKTTLIKSLLGQSQDGTSPTLGFNIHTIPYTLNDVVYAMNVWDVGGQKTIRAYWKNYFEQTDGIIWVVDSCDQIRLDECRHNLHSLLTEQKLFGASVIIVANKQDVSGALTPGQISDILEMDKLQGHEWNVLGCSAKTGQDIHRVFDWLVKHIALRLYYSLQ